MAWQMSNKATTGQIVLPYLRRTKKDGKTDVVRDGGGERGDRVLSERQGKVGITVTSNKESARLQTS